MSSALRLSLVPAAASAPPPVARTDVWPAHVLGQASLAVWATGEPALDAQLPGGGWPLGALVEILQPEGRHCEWRLLLPALARHGTGPVVLVGPPHVPFAPALAAQGLAPQRLLRVDAAADNARLWAAEQALACAPVDAVLAWLPQARGPALRRLQMVAATHAKGLFVMRPQSARAQASPAQLRLAVQPAPAPQGGVGAVAALAVEVELFKRRGPPLADALALPAGGTALRRLLAAGAPNALDRRMCTA